MRFTFFEELHGNIRDWAEKMSDSEVRSLVEHYYNFQEERKRFDNQLKAEEEQPFIATEHFRELFKTSESIIKRGMDTYSRRTLIGRWMRSIPGIGPVISAGMLAHLDIEKAPVAGSFWRYAGLDPEMEWGEGEKRPYNAEMLTLCWKLGESFVKVKNHDDEVYGSLIEERKEYEHEMNNRGEYKGQALERAKKIEAEARRKGKKPEEVQSQYETYKDGRLPTSHIHERGKRWGVKLFLSHLHTVMCEEHPDMEPPDPWVIVHDDHEHYMPPPNWPFER